MKDVVLHRRPLFYAHPV